MNLKGEIQTTILVNVKWFIPVYLPLWDVHIYCSDCDLALVELNGDTGAEVVDFALHLEALVQEGFLQFKVLIDEKKQTIAQPRPH